MPEDFLRTAQDSVAYGMVDGSMILTREPGWKEVKVGRIFLEGHHGQVSKDRNGISHSIYRARLGGHKDFEEHFSTRRCSILWSERSRRLFLSATVPAGYEIT